MHAPRWRVFRRLAHADKGDSLFGLQPLQFHVIEQVARSAVNLVEQKAVQLLRVGFGVGDEFLKCRALVGFAGRFGNAPHAHDLAAIALRVCLQRCLLHVKAKTLAFLFAAAHARQRNEALRLRAGLYARVLRARD